MRHSTVRPGNLVLGLLLLAGRALGSPVSVQASRDDVALVSISIAYTSPRGSSEPAAESRIEYRSGHQLWMFKPFGGMMASSNGVLHGYVGLLIDFYLPANLVFTPSFAPGLYHPGRGKDLGFPLEFRSQIELSYRFITGMRIGVGVNHISNARLGRINPGIEAVSITLSTPEIQL